MQRPPPEIRQSQNWLDRIVREQQSNHTKVTWSIPVTFFCTLSKGIAVQSLPVYLAAMAVSAPKCGHPLEASTNFHTGGTRTKIRLDKSDWLAGDEIEHESIRSKTCGFPASPIKSLSGSNRIAPLCPFFRHRCLSSKQKLGSTLV